MNKAALPTYIKGSFNISIARVLTGFFYGSKHLKNMEAKIKIKQFFYTLIAGVMALATSACSDIVDYFDRLGQHMPTYDSTFGNNQDGVVKHALPADSAKPQSPDVDRYLQQQRQEM